MHQSTYERIRDAIFRCEETRDDALAVFLTRMMKRCPEAVEGLL
jgi:hypothetical protein